MDLNKDEICSICFEKDNCIIPARTVRELTETLFIDLEGTANENLLLCQNCVKEIHKAYDFKMVCLDAEEILTINQCRLCKSQLGKNVRNYLTKIFEITHMKEIFQKHIPELDLWLTRNPKICNVCLKSLFSFRKLLVSLHARKPINLAPNVELVTTYEKSFPAKAPTKKMTVYKEGVKASNTSKDDTDNQINTIQCDKCHFETEDPQAYEKHRRFLHTEIHHCPWCSFSTEIESFLHSHLTRHKVEDIKNHLKDNPKVSIALKEDTYKKNNTIQCDKCKFETEDPQAYEKHRRFVHTKIHHCPWCSFSTEIELFLHSHLTRHKVEDIKNNLKDNQKVLIALKEDTYKKTNTIQCDKCNFVTEDHNAYEKHIHFVHTEIHHCPRCTFSTEIESFLHSHFSRHKVEDIKNHVEDNKRYGDQHQLYIHECELCNFQTINMEDLKAHIDQHM